MSQVYSTEPQTSANVIFETTYGPLSIHLWLKECPRTTMYFLQLCADGFYDNIVFHRIVPNFLIQTGDSKFRINQQEQDGGVVDVTSKNNTKNDNYDDISSSSKLKQPPPPKYRDKHGAAEALDRRQFEVNSRIRFNHRGQVAMALGIDDDDTNNDGPRLQPQFFITLEDASHLDNKHVIFGGVTGPTIFNALRIGQIDVINNNDDDIRNFQPRIISEAPRILRTKIIQVEIPATLPALVPTVEPYLMPWRIDLNKINNEGGVTAGNDGKSKRKKKARKGIKNVNLLSFGEEFNGEDDDDDDDDDGKNKLRIQSSHDLLGKDKKYLKSQPSSSRLNNQTIEKSHRQPSQEEEDKDLPTEKKQESKKVQDEEVQEPGTKDNDNAVVTYQRKKDIKYTPSDSIVPSQMEESNSGSAKKNNRSTSTEKKPKKISLVEARRAKYLKKNSNKKGNRQQREEETMTKFKAFQQKITIGGGANEKVEKRKIKNNKDDEEQHDVKGYHGQILDASDDSNWMNTKFQCKKHMDQDAKTGGDGRRADDYEVIDERSTATDRKHGKRKKYQH
jgi:peptidyl-prolyl cis-trans isomerase SDCCAG10